MSRLDLAESLPELHPVVRAYGSSLVAKLESKSLDSGHRQRVQQILDTLRALFPLCDVHAGAHKPAPLQLRVLLVEDNAINRRIALRMLARLGLTPDVCADGYEAVNRLATQSYDLIFMDVQMPRMDGLEATHRIRALQRTEQATRIIAFTANSTDEMRDACKAAGMDGFLAKPFTLEDLADTLISLLR